MCRTSTIERRSTVFRSYIPDRILTVVTADIGNLTVFDMDVMIGAAAIRLYTDPAALFVDIIIAPVAHTQIVDLPILLIAEIYGRSRFSKRTIVILGRRIRIAAVSIDQRLLAFPISIDDDRRIFTSASFWIQLTQKDRPALDQDLIAGSKLNVVDIIQRIKSGRFRQSVAALCCLRIQIIDRIARVLPGETVHVGSSSSRMRMTSK